MSRGSGAPGMGWTGLIGGSAATSGVVRGEGLCSVLVTRMLGLRRGDSGMILK